MRTSLLVFVICYISYGTGSLPIECQRKFRTATGNCNNEGPSVRYGYDKEKGDCVRYYYNSCRGNKNNFASRSECLNRCNPESRCLLFTYENEGNWRLFKSYYYNATLDECRLTKTYTYHSTSEKYNRFANMKDCEKACRRNDTEDVYSSG
uniref:Uncharacterized protein HLSG-g45 n=1 Tax=Haemaphysalis longicornis TaxID=44386 RepID=Q4LDX2_HAELO|nr:hypothetical protein [Haemaphysalis longicornis]